VTEDIQPTQSAAKSSFQAREVLILLAVLIGIQVAAFMLTAQLRRPPRIAFMSDREGNLDIYLMNFDGSNVVNLSRNESADFLPDWSQSLGAFVFLSAQDLNTVSLFRMNDDGNDSIIIIESMPILGSKPTWSPNGEWIAFQNQQDGQGELYVVNAAGTQIRNLSNHPASDQFSDWSPDGKHILFSSNRRGPRTLYQVDLDDGSIAILLDDLFTNATADWSPDGKLIAFASDRAVDVEIYVLEIESGNITQLTQSPGLDAFPIWSPDGSKLAFLSVRDGNPEIYVMQADGSQALNLTNHPARDAAQGDFSWSPDGLYILFQSDRDGDIEIYRIDADGGNMVNLSNNPAADRASIWVP